ncbi:MAG: pilus assembly protein [Bryobacterales bacterium]|nr:pilus assembly protein [Bryobacterales bacterium]
MRADRHTGGGGRARRGHAVVEVALLAPWIFFLFVGAFDMGFYAYSLISTENAARAAALYTSDSPAATTDQAGACCFALKELEGMGNVRGPAFSATACACVDIAAVDDANPVGVRVEELDSTTAPPSMDGQLASRVTVRYRTIRMVPIPGVLSGQETMTRAVEMRVRQW